MRSRRSRHKQALWRLFQWSSIQGVSINEVVSNSKYYDPLMKVKDGDIIILQRCINPDGTPADKGAKEQLKYDSILSRLSEAQQGRNSQ